MRCALNSIKMKYFFSFALFIILFSNCDNTLKTGQNTTQSPDSMPNSAQKAYSRPTFISTTTVDATETPHSVVSFSYGSTVVKVDTAIVGEFQLMEDEEMKQMNMPNTFMVVGKAFWAGLQVTLVIDTTVTTYIIKRQYQDEQGSGKEPFETIKIFPK